MSTLTVDPRLAPNPSPVASSRIARIAALAAAETKLLLRNRSALATGVLMGPLMVLFVGFMATGGLTPDADFGVFIVSSALGWCALFTVYYNLTGIFVARRESRVFKRLSTGEATSWDALTASSVPSTVVMLAQLVLAAVVAFLMFGMPEFTNPLVAVIGLVGIVVVCVALAAVSTTFTSSVEAAQYSTLPVFLVLILFSGTTLPLAVMPEWAQIIASYTPLNAATELVVVGLSGANMAGEAAGGFVESFSLTLHPIAVLAGWTALSVFMAARTMRFEPRR